MSSENRALVRRIGELHLFRLAGGQIVEHWRYHDALGLMKQLRSSEPLG